MNRILSIVFPHRCPICDGVVSSSLDEAARQRAALLFYPASVRRAEAFSPQLPRGLYAHEKCLRKLHIVHDPRCMRCGRELKSDDSAYCPDCLSRERHFLENRALISYNAAAQKSMALLKYHGRQEIARFYALLLADRYAAWLKEIAPDAILPVPIHRSRLAVRGYNQAELITHELGRLTGLPVRGDLLLRTRRTRAQKTLGPEERIRNMQHALTVRGDPRIQKVLLVDDIYTTGSTLEACTRALLDAGVQEIYTLTVCVSEAT